MNYNRRFKLKKYFGEWKREIEAFYRDVNWRRGLVNYDDVDWCMGTNVVVARPEEVNRFINEDLGEIYKRKDVGLKIFYKQAYPRTMNMHSVSWGNSFINPDTGQQNLVAATKIQNIIALQGVAARVYDLVFLYDGEAVYPAQVVEYVPGNLPDEDNQARWETAMEVMKTCCSESGIDHYDIDMKNWKAGKCIDFQSFKFSRYAEFAKVRFEEGLYYGGGGKPYQSIEELLIPGFRNNVKRNKVLKINARELPKNFTALDVGCNGAYFLRRAFDAGAGYGMGIDLPKVTEATAELLAFLGYFNADFQEELPDMEFDCVFMLSAFGYYEVADIAKRVKRILYIEGHNLNVEHTEEKYREKLEPYFKKIKTLGWVQDEPELQPRVVMKAYK